MKHKPTNSDDPSSLITKREYFAAFALAGILSGKYEGNMISDDVETAVDAADKLIKKLNGEYL